MTRPLRGYCLVCDREVSLRKDGTTISHPTEGSFRWNPEAPICRGAGQLPHPDPAGGAPSFVNRYRKRPATIQAVFLTPQMNEAQLREVAEWCGGSVVPYVAPDGSQTRGVAIPTLEGVMTAPLGWWVIQGVEGEFYPCRADIFAQAFEKV